MGSLISSRFIHHEATSFGPRLTCSESEAVCFPKGRTHVCMSVPCSLGTHRKHEQTTWLLYLYRKSLPALLALCRRYLRATARGPQTTSNHRGDREAPITARVRYQRLWRPPSNYDMARLSSRTCGMMRWNVDPLKPFTGPSPVQSCRKFSVGNPRPKENSTPSSRQASVMVLQTTVSGRAARRRGAPSHVLSVLYGYPTEGAAEVRTGRPLEGEKRKETWLHGDVSGFRLR